VVTVNAPRSAEFDFVLAGDHEFQHMVDDLQKDGRNATWSFAKIYEVYPRSVVLDEPQPTNRGLQWITRTNRDYRRIIVAQTSTNSFKILSMTTADEYRVHRSRLQDLRDDHEASVKAGTSVAQDDHNLFLYDDSAAGARYLARCPAAIARTMRNSDRPRN